MTKQRKNRQEIAEAVRIARTKYEAALAKFQERLGTNPVYAFEWGEDAVRAAVCLDTLAMLENAATFDLSTLETPRTEEEQVNAIYQHFDDEADRMAKRVPSSTSVMSNFTENHKRAYYCEVRGWLRGDFLSSL